MSFDERSKAILTEGGVDVDSVLNAWARGHESLYTKHLHRFSENKNLQEFVDAIEDGDLEAAYRAIHTLKTVSANLGFTDLFQLAQEGTEGMKDPDQEKQREARNNGQTVALLPVLPDKVSAMIPAMRAEMDRMIALVAQLDA